MSGTLEFKKFVKLLNETAGEFASEEQQGTATEKIQDMARGIVYKCALCVADSALEPWSNVIAKVAACPDLECPLSDHGPVFCMEIVEVTNEHFAV
jgi:hypothetical protein